MTLPQHDGTLRVALCEPSGVFTDLERRATPSLFLAPEDAGNLIAGAAALGFAGVELIGAPTLQAPGLEAALDAAHAHGLGVRLQTDGRGLTATQLERILAACTPWAFVVGLDGRSPPDHDRVRGAGGWAAAVAAIRALIEARQPTYLQTVVRSDTFTEDAEVDAFIDWAADELEVRGVWFGRPIGPAGAPSAWAPPPERVVGFRALLDDRPHWRGFVTHAWHHAPSPAAPAGETLAMCDRLEACDAAASPRGVHPCPALTDLVVAPLEASLDYLASPIRAQRLQWLRAAAVAYEAGPVLSCAECVVALRRLHGQALAWSGTPAPVEADAEPDDAEALHAVRIAHPKGLRLVIGERCSAGCDHDGAAAASDGAWIEVAVADRLLRDAQFAGIATVTFEGPHVLAHPGLEELLGRVARYALKVELRGWGPDAPGREALLAQFRPVIERLWLPLRGGAPGTHDGATGQPGSFAVTLATLAWAAEVEVPTGAHVVLDDDAAVEEAAGLLASLADRGVGHVVLERGLLGGDREALRERREAPHERRLHTLLQERRDLVQRFESFESPFLAARRGDGVCLELVNRPAAADVRGRLHPCSRSACGVLGPDPTAWPAIDEGLLVGLAAVAPVQAALVQGRDAGFAGSEVGGRFGRCEYCAELLAGPDWAPAAGRSGAPAPPAADGP